MIGSEENNVKEVVNPDEYPLVYVAPNTDVVMSEVGGVSVGPIVVTTKPPTHLPPDEYAHLPVVVYKNGQRIVVGQAILSGSEILATVEDSGLAEEIMGHAFRTDEISLGPVGIPRPRRRNATGDPRARFGTPRNIEPKGIYKKRGK